LTFSQVVFLGAATSFPGADEVGATTSLDLSSVLAEVVEVEGGGGVEEAKVLADTIFVSWEMVEGGRMRERDCPTAKRAGR